MRHHPHYVATRTADAGNIVERPVRVRLGRYFTLLIAVAKHDAVVALQLRERALVAEIIAFHVTDGNAQYFTLPAGVGEERVRILNSNMHRLTNILQPGVAHQSSRQQSCLAQNLKSVADPDHQAALARKLSHRLHY